MIEKMARYIIVSTDDPDHKQYFRSPKGTSARWGCNWFSYHRSDAFEYKTEAGALAAMKKWNIRGDIYTIEKIMTSA